MPITADRAKPASPSVDVRMVDFVLSNLANAGFLKIVVLTQYNPTRSTGTSQDLAMSTLLGNYVTPCRRAARGPCGSRFGDAIYQAST